MSATSTPRHGRCAMSMAATIEPVTIRSTTARPERARSTMPHATVTQPTTMHSRSERVGIAYRKKRRPSTARSTIAALALLVALLSAPDALHAQFEPVPRRSLELLPVAEQYARENLPSDAVLVLVGAIGNVTVGPGIPLTIDADSGTSSAWAYIYHTPASGRWISLAVFELPAMGVQVSEGDPPAGVPITFTDRLDLTGPYAESGRMSSALHESAAYQVHRERHRRQTPSRAAYRDPAGADSAVLPSTFPLDAPLWSIEYTGRGDSAMTCWVSGRTGQAHCVSGIAASIDDAASRAESARVAPTPASDAVTVTTSRGIERIWLADVSGAVIAAPRIATCDTDGCSVRFDVGALAAGVYVVMGSSERGGTATLGRVVVAR